MDIVSAESVLLLPLCGKKHDGSLLFQIKSGKAEWLSLVGILGILSGLPMLLLLPALEKKYSKRSLMFFSIILYIAGDLLIYIGRNQTVCLLAGLVITG